MWGSILKGHTMKHKWLRNFDADGKWTKPSRDIRIEVDGKIKVVNMDEYAKELGIILPDSKKPKKQVNSNEDIRQQDNEGDDPIVGDGISEDTE